MELSLSFQRKKDIPKGNALLLSQTEWDVHSRSLLMISSSDYSMFREGSYLEPLSQLLCF